MNAARKHLPRTGWRLRVAGLVVLGLFMFGLALSHDEALHCWAHADAQSSGHHCFVTLLAKGQIDTASPAVALEAAAVLILPAPRPNLPVCRAADYTLLPVRGPPAIPA